MAGLTETATWETEVYQIETTDPVLGGAPNVSTGAGMSNIPHLQLARRTSYLKAQVDQLQTGGGYRSAETLGGSVTLTSADMGKCLIYGDTTAITITLPLVASIPAGSAVEVINTGTANVTVQRQGSDNIDNGPTSVTSIVIPPGMSLRLVRATGSSLWHPVSVSASGLATVFGSSLAASGWQRLPSGLILQWGSITTSVTNGSNSVWTFPIAFPTACRFVSAFYNEASGPFTDITTPLFCVARSATQATFRSYTGNENGIDVFAIGH